jgi:secondary thiamine-phosphate synthase enzyme
MVASMIYREIFKVETKYFTPLDLTNQIGEILDRCQIRDGTCNIFIPATTAGLTLNEDDKMLVEDFRRLFDELASQERLYHHPENGHSHLRASLFGQSLTVPVNEGRLILGDWQRVFLWEFDKKSRDRKIIISISD